MNKSKPTVCWSIGNAVKRERRKRRHREGMGDRRETKRIMYVGGNGMNTRRDREREEKETREK